jgi:hypothetical protein
MKKPVVNRNPDMKALQVYIPEELHRQAMQKADDVGFTVTQVVRKALQTWVASVMDMPLFKIDGTVAVSQQAGVATVPGKAITKVTQIPIPKCYISEYVYQGRMDYITQWNEKQRAYVAKNKKLAHAGPTWIDSAMNCYVHAWMIDPDTGQLAENEDMQFGPDWMNKLTEDPLKDGGM